MSMSVSGINRSAHIYIYIYMLVRASFGASLYTTAHEQHEWPPRVSGRAVRESKQKMRKAECMHTLLRRVLYSEEDRREYMLLLGTGDG